jgi:hypothetical protein
VRVRAQRRDLAILILKQVAGAPRRYDQHWFPVIGTRSRLAVAIKSFCRWRHLRPKSSNNLSTALLTCTAHAHLVLVVHDQHRGFRKGSINNVCERSTATV